MVQLVVNDGMSNSAPDTVIISTNFSPVADAGPDQDVTVADLVSLDGSGSSDADLEPLTYSWSFIQRPAGSTAILSDPTNVAPTFSADVAGAYEVQLIVNDGSQDSDPDLVVITANPPSVYSSDGCR